MGSLDKFRKAPHAKTFGMEVECYPRGLAPTRTYHGFWWCTDDASLNLRGREFVSQPMPYDMLVNQIKKLHKRVEGWKVDEQCGLHIHVSRLYMSPSQERKLSAALSGFTREQIKYLFGRFSHYALPTASIHDKFRAINLRHDDTYEFRVWKAGDLEWTLEALRRTRILVTLKDCSFEGMCKAFGLHTKSVIEQVRHDLRQIRVDYERLLRGTISAAAFHASTLR